MSNDQTIYELAGGEFVIDSPKQLGEVLFERLGLPTFRRGKTGWSTDRKVLQLLEGKHPIIGLIGRYRELTKLDSTYLSALPENAGRASLTALTDKLRAGASAAPSRLAVAEESTDETLATVRRAVASGHRLEFDYLNARGERRRRRVDPLRIASLGADWYLQAYDHLREDVRNFRVDRMSDLEVTDEPIGDHSGRAIPETLFQASPDDLEVVVDVAPATLPLLGDYLADSTHAEAGDRLRVTLRLAHVHGLKRLVAGLPGLVTVVAPEEARRAVAEWAEAGLTAYGEAPADSDPA